jgi:hypothetical protein
VARIDPTDLLDDFSLPPDLDPAHLEESLSLLQSWLNRFRGWMISKVEEEKSVREWIDQAGAWEYEIYQENHGLSALEVVKMGVTSWSLADGTAEANLGDALILRVPDFNRFIITSNGVVEVLSHGLTVGTPYWLSASTPGALTTTKPTTGNWAQHVLTPISRDLLLVNLQRPADDVP